MLFPCAAVASEFVQTRPLSFGTIAPTAPNAYISVSTGGLVSVSNMTIISGGTNYNGTGLFEASGLSSLLGVALATEVLTDPIILTNGTGGQIIVSNVDATGDRLLTLLSPDTDVSVGGTAFITPTSTPGDYVGYVDIRGGLLLSGLLGDSADMTMTITLTLLAQLQVDEITPLDFGAIGIKGGNSVVRIAPISGNRSVVSGADGVDLIPSSPGAGGLFEVRGSPNTLVSIQVSPSTQISGDNGGTMVVDNFMCFPNCISLTIGVDGWQTLGIGADLHVNPGQAAGIYNGTYTISVNY